MTPVERLLAVASAEVGYLEKTSNFQLDSKTANAGSANYTKYARDLDAMGVYHARKQGLSWCDIFADWCFVQAFGLDAALRMTGQPKGGYGAGCTESANYYRRMGRFHQSGPQPGDQIFFSNSSGGMAHTGIVERVANGKVYTIEGNTSGASGVVANGGGVCRKSYSLTYNRIGGYGRPDYSIVQEDDIMTGEEIYNALQAHLDKQPLPAWAKTELAEAVKMGITDGKDPMQFIPRYQAAIMAKRAAERV